ncbi:hypothetical protein H5410_004302 [Solanum commersonii]|uniref:Polyprotein protein n=1 Tax=Solanum commersonii TaxID=4109 RepID=A0A9J6B7E0_SOLCO|nr:hypothetical protein H5410_004302 [Solanum commersonii]
MLLKMGDLAHSADVRASWLKDEVTSLKVEVSDLRKDMDYLKSTDFTSLFESAEAPGVPTSSDMPSATTEDKPMNDLAATELEAETDEEQLNAQEAIIYKDMLDLEEMIVQFVI